MKHSQYRKKLSKDHVIYWYAELEQSLTQQTKPCTPILYSTLINEYQYLEYIYNWIEAISIEGHDNVIEYTASLTWYSNPQGVK